MASAFIPKEFRNHDIVNHINGIPTDNRAENLEWTDQTGNVLHDVKLRGNSGRKRTAIVKLDKDTDVELERFVGIGEAATAANVRRIIMSQTAHSGGIIGGFRWKVVQKIVDESDLPGEIWKALFEPFARYQVSSHGRLRSVSGKLLRLQTAAGYLKVQLKRLPAKPKMFQVHRLVAYMFCPAHRSDLDPDNLVVNHLDKNKSNNHFTNLQWCTISENTIHAVGRAVNKLDATTGAILQTFDSIVGAAKSVGEFCDCNAIVRACKPKRKPKQFSGFRWAFAPVSNNE